MSDVIMRLVTAEHDARGFGFSYPTVEDVIQQIQDECQEVLDAISQNESVERQQEEIGDLMHAAMALCYHQGYSIDESLSLSLDKFEKRMGALKSIARDKDLASLEGQSLDQMLVLWKQAKKAVG
ncbi:MazG nucleotide pyrophosphohydrolase domain-containing protein [Candidatus Synchoanobacter obligatus]|uniref:Nucleotide pyrophosphohydrolase n=1 Tax=Candidatus Synchoanobacter obligatus TaxID=2919597 RepID=A0ABT1L3H7_9GAMM|nr:MazG nucleotide pyrophosphohydrolase domain-containing protein [Candidatus Synchoanobacter obligatus]MCP8351709.1 nucleotide pyrophosphohydrolase [Candidatus Synchoanobacter obligatus]